MAKSKWDEQQRRRRAKFHATHPEIAKKYPAYRAYYLPHTYGMTPGDYNALLKVQKRRCAICSRTREESGGKYLAVDHCHETGRVRGLLCDRCNLAVGKARESVAGAATAQPIIREALKVYIVTRCIPAKLAGPLAK